MTLGIAAKAKAMKAAGEDVVSMSAGEPDFDTPSHIKKAAVRALEAGETKYTPAAGRPDLRKAVAAKFREDNGIACEPEQVIVAPGAKFSVFSAVAALCSPGDEVLIPAPYWLSYPEMVKAAGATPVIVPTRAEAGFTVDASVLKKFVSTRTKLLIFNSPSNPTGAVYAREQLEEIASLAVEHAFMVLADEIYEKLVYDGVKHVSIASLNERILAQTITVNGFSKSYAMTGWRLGYLAAPAWLAPKIAALQSHTTSNPTSFAQAGALVALQSSQEAVEQMRQAFEGRRSRIYDLLSRISGVRASKPRGAFYIFPDISEYGIDSMSFAGRLLDERKLAVVPGKPFGADNHIRLSYACSLENIEKACSRLAEFCAGL